MNKLLTTLLTVASLALAVPAMAGGCKMTTSDPEVATSSGFYVDHDLCQPRCLVSVWIYEESNGIDGLQRDDRNHDDTCNGLAGEADSRLD